MNNMLHIVQLGQSNQNKLPQIRKFLEDYVIVIRSTLLAHVMPNGFWMIFANNLDERGEKLLKIVFLLGS